MNVAVWPASFWVTWITILLCVVAAMMVAAFIWEWWQYTADKAAAKVYLRQVFIVIFWVVVIGLFFGLGRTHAHDQDHPELDEWYATLKQNDVPTVSCCGEADSYFCDEVHVRDGKAFCFITDERDDAPLRRRHLPIGTEIEIPPNKMNKDPNPTGHSVIFLSSANYVWCFVFNGGS